MITKVIRYGCNTVNRMKSYCSNYKLNKIIVNYKYIHIIFNDKFCIPFIDFINEKFDPMEHLFLVVESFPQFEFPKGGNIVRIYGMQGLDFSDSRIKLVIMHSLFLDGCVRYWYKNQEILGKKTFWMIWGGDLYEAKRNTMEDTVRRGFKGYISDTDGDCNVVKEKYDLKGKIFIDAAYSFPISISMIDNAIADRKEHNYIQIQINNSCDKTTISMLNTLSKYSNENIKIVVVLSYGDLQYKDEIISKGKKIFKNKFEYLEEYLSPEEYARWLSQNDIYILNQDRQQGLGNSFASLAEGAKLFIKSNITTYHHFNDKGIKVYDTLDINHMSYSEFKEYESNIKDKNMKEVRRFFDNEYLKKCWEPIFRIEE